MTGIRPDDSTGTTVQLGQANSESRRYVRSYALNYTKIIKIIRITGLMALLSYMTVILFVWIYANLGGYVYFSAGEPVLMIKYSEWALGFTGIVVAFDYLCREIRV